MSITVRPLHGAELLAALDDLGRLRMRVFRAFPYLYEGDAAYEARYLARYGAHEAAILVGAWDGARLVGASTGMPLTAHDDIASMSLPDGAPPAERIYYCAESVLLAQYRGQGIGHRFFDYREDLARRQGFGWAGFASVMRPADHPMRPTGYRPLDGFWRARGYAPLPGAIARFSWADVGDTEQSEKELQLWLRTL